MTSLCWTTEDSNGHLANSNWYLQLSEGHVYQLSKAFVGFCRRSKGYVLNPTGVSSLPFNRWPAGDRKRFKNGKCWHSSYLICDSKGWGGKLDQECLTLSGGYYQRSTAAAQCWQHCCSRSSHPVIFSTRRSLSGPLYATNCRHLLPASDFRWRNNCRSQFLYRPPPPPPLAQFDRELCSEWVHLLDIKYFTRSAEGSWTWSHRITDQMSNTLCTENRSNLAWMCFSQLLQPLV